jgi:transcription initiation factor TFIIIB Brf1 subunit/transcription initiation factor TFIIB
VYFAKIANKGRASEKAYHRSLHMLSIIKDNPISHCKDPNALAVAVLYVYACLEVGKKISQTQIALAGDTSIVTLRKRFQVVRKIFARF